jgi:hypothetical protein
MIPNVRAVLRVGRDARLLPDYDTIATCCIDNGHLAVLAFYLLVLMRIRCWQGNKVVRQFALKFCHMVGMIGVIECCVSASVAAVN